MKQEKEKEEEDDEPRIYKCNYEMGKDENGNVLRCVREFKQKTNLKEHMAKGTNHSYDIKDPKVRDKKYHGEPMVCTFVIGNDGENDIICGRVFTEIWKYNQHKKKMLSSSHGPVSKYETQSKSMNLDSKDGEKVQVVKCKYCDLTFESKRTKFRHEIKHTEYKDEQTEGVQDVNYKCEFIVDIDPVNG